MPSSSAMKSPSKPTPSSPITTPAAQSENATPSNNRITTITAQGNAHITHKNAQNAPQTATGDEAIYDAENKTITINGNVELHEGENTPHRR